MNNQARRLLAIAITIALSACGGSNDTSDEDAYRALLEQFTTCWSVASGSTSADSFNSAANTISSAPESAVCKLWPQRMNVSCHDAYALYSNPYSGKCI